MSEQPPGLLTKEIGKDVLLGCESTNSTTGRPVNASSFSQSCVPVSVARVDEDKDADENVDADQTRTVRPVGGQEFTQEIEKDILCGHEDIKHLTRTEWMDQNPSKVACRCLLKTEEEDQTRMERPVGGQESTQVEELDIDFRIPGVSHAVVKEAENFRVQELVKKIESHPHREALQADLQQNNVYNPFSNNSKAMIRELGNVELFKLCETVPKVQCSLIRIKDLSTALADSSWLKANPEESLTNKDWMHSLSRTT